MENNIWEKIFKDQTWGQYPAEPLIRFIAKNFYAKNRKRTKILELGCGPGANLWYFAREGFSFRGIDGSAAAVMQAKVRLNKECPGWEKRGVLTEGDITKINLGKDNFDAVIDNECCYCLNFDDAQKVYNKAYKALKGGGKIFVRTFSTETWGYRTGKKKGNHFYECGKGPLANKGNSRFTTRNQISRLLHNFNHIIIEKETHSLLNGQKIIAEWIINAEK